MVDYPPGDDEIKYLRITGRLCSNEDIVAGLIRRQFEVEKTRLIVLGALAGSVVAGGVDAALDGRWVAAVAASVLTFLVGALWEWRWSVAMRVPGSDKENDGRRDT